MSDPDDHRSSGEPAGAAEDGARKEPGSEVGETAPADRDARVEFQISEDLLSVSAKAITPAFGQGRPLSEERLRELLVQDGVFHGVLDEAVAELVETFSRSGDCDSSLVLARGQRAEEGRPGRVEAIDRLEDTAVFPGDAFARLVPTEQPQPGRAVTGAAIPAPPGLPEIEIKAGEHCRVSDDGTQAIATAYGEALLEGARAAVQPGIRVVEGGLVCEVDVFPRRIGDQPFAEADLLGALEAAGILGETMDLETLHARWSEAEITRAPQRGIEAAHGIKPEPGRDGQILFTVDIEDRVGTVDDRGRIDFKEQNRLHRVHKDDQIAALVPHTPGKPGRGVLGQEIPARPGKKVELRLGPGVREEDGGLYANLGGALVAQPPSFDVSNSFRVSGDVDYHSGNITNDSGSVFVEGSVLAGFRITAGGDVEVGHSVEGGTVEAGGAIIVREAIIGKEGSSIRAVKDIRTGYIQNADLTCDGDLTVEREVIQSRIKVTGVLRITGQPGAIVGGEVEADGGIVTTALGSSNGVPTIIRIGRGTRRISLLSDSLNEKMEPLKQIRARLGGGSVAELLDRLSQMIATAEAEYEEVATPALADQIARLKERRTSIRRLLRLHRELEAECRELEERLKEAEKERERQVVNGTPACVEVRGMVFPGVVFMIDGATFPVTKPFSAVRFFYNSLKRRVEARRNF